MKDCPRCASVQAWVLGDGRLKCRTCGRRYSWTSVWDSVRLSESAKHALLDAFVRGMPAAQSTADQACADSRERFYRLIRACCAQHERLPRDGLAIAQCHMASARSAMRGWAMTQQVIIVGIAERHGNVRISAPAGEIQEILPLLRERTAVGGVVQLGSTQAYACLQIQGDYVSVPRTTRAPLGLQPAQEFWHFARSHLQIFRKIPLKFFPLYLAETCLRFNHRSDDMRTLLHAFMSSTASGEVKMLLRNESSNPIVRIHRAESAFHAATCGASQSGAS
jgi:transposase